MNPITIQLILSSEPLLIASLTIISHNSWQSLIPSDNSKSKCSSITSHTPSEAITQNLSKWDKLYVLIWGKQIKPFPFKLKSPKALVIDKIPSNLSQ